MKRNGQRPRSPRNHAGLTLIELIVIVLILGLTVALLFPAMRRTSHVAARRLQCLNNLKQLGTAVANYQSQNGDKLPALAVESKGAVYGWPIQLLPLLDSAALARQIRDDRAAVIDPKSGQPTISLRFFTCPEDPNNFRVRGGLSYAANVGYVSSDVWGIRSADGDRNLASFHAAGTIAFGGSDFAERVAIHRGTGLFWRDATAPSDPSAPSSREELPRLTGDEIHRADGLSSTLLFAENMQARNWASVNDIGFGLRVPVGSGSHAPDRAKPGGRIGEDGKPLALPGWAPAGPDLLNANVNKARPGEAPRPSSFHAGGIVNVVYADGHASTLNESIDPSVYARLLTWDGETHGQQKVDLNLVE